MKTNVNITKMKNVVVAMVLVAVTSGFSLQVKAQKHSLLAMNSQSKRFRIENQLASLTREIENSVRYSAPNFDEENINITASNAIPSKDIIVANELELRSWIENKLKKEMSNCDFSVDGKISISFIIDKDGRINNIKTLNNAPKKIEEMLMSIISKAPLVQPLYMNGYPAKRYIKLPVTYSVRTI